MNIDKQFLEKNGVDVENINQVIKEFQKAGANYTGLQCAVAMELLLRTLCPEAKHRTMVKELVDNFFNIDVNR